MSRYKGDCVSNTLKHFQYKLGLWSVSVTVFFSFGSLRFLVL